MFKEEFEERAAIMEYDGGLSREMAEAEAEKHRHACEVRYWVNRCYPNGLEMADQMARIEKKRGKAAADALRADARIEWAKRRAAE